MDSFDIIADSYTKLMRLLLLEATFIFDMAMFRYLMFLCMLLWSIGMIISFGITSFEIKKHKMHKLDVKVVYILAYILKNVFIWPWVIGRKFGKLMDRF